MEDERGLVTVDFGDSKTEFDAGRDFMQTILDHSIFNSMEYGEDWKRWLQASIDAHATQDWIILRVKGTDVYAKLGAGMLHMGSLLLAAEEIWIQAGRPLYQDSEV